ncbi:MAG: amidophosphoribosyltransferase [Clostridia bacterium]|nr:amidophosphoribosyltransferase [Clostridia bacterium]
MSLREECGVFGIFAPEETDAAALCYYGLYALQHRGQESCGIVAQTAHGFVSHKDLGLVGDVFSQEVLQRFPRAAAAIGHVRYGTTGGSSRRNCQPIAVNHRNGSLALAHNGNLANAGALRDALEANGAIFHSTSDTETIAHLITRERLTAPSTEEAVSRVMPQLTGAYSLVLLTADRMLCVRDPHGFRPLCIGKTPAGVWIAASESCAIRAVGGRKIRDLLPGEILTVSKAGVSARREHCGTAPQRTCIFEYIYFARPDSEIDGVSVHDARLRAGAALAEAHPAQADLVIGVPDSGVDAALGYSRAAGIPYGIGLIKNKYIGRTFIAPDGRLDKVKIKLSAIESAVRGKRLVLIDDSIVRGTTSGRIVQLLREAGAKEIHLRISAPPFLHPCYYGTDIDSEEHLIASRHTPQEVAALIGVDSLGYLPVAALPSLTGGSGFCSACFSGDYPTAVPGSARKDQFE